MLGGPEPAGEVHVGAAGLRGAISGLRCAEAGARWIRIAHARGPRGPGIGPPALYGARLDRPRAGGNRHHGAEWLSSKAGALRPPPPATRSARAAGPGFGVL